MPLEVSGTICHVEPVVQISESFRKREFVLHWSYEYNGDTFNEYCKLQAINTGCDYLSENPNEESLRFMVGDHVKVTFKLKGSRNKTNGTVYNNLTMLTITALKQEYAPVAPAAPAPAPPLTYDQQMHSFHAQQPPAFVYGQNPEQIDDLPF